MKLRTLIASFTALAGISIAQAATDATDIEPTLAISFKTRGDRPIIRRSATACPPAGTAA